MVGTGGDSRRTPALGSPLVQSPPAFEILSGFGPQHSGTELSVRMVPGSPGAPLLLGHGCRSPQHPQGCFLLACGMARRPEASPSPGPGIAPLVRRSGRGPSCLLPKKVNTSTCTLPSDRPTIRRQALLCHLCAVRAPDPHTRPRRGMARGCGRLILRELRVSAGVRPALHMVRQLSCSFVWPSTVQQQDLSR